MTQYIYLTLHMARLSKVILGSKILLGIAGFLVIILFFLPVKSDALTSASMNFNDVPTTVAQYMRYYDTNLASPCYYSTNSQNPGAFQWISPPNQSTTDLSNTSYSVKGGVSSVSLNLWHALLFCRQNVNNPNTEIVNLNTTQGAGKTGAPENGTVSSNELISLSYDIKDINVTSVSGGGYSTGNVTASLTSSKTGQISTAPSFLNNRYFFSYDDFNLNFKPSTPTSSSTDTTITVNIVVKTIYLEEWYGVYYCTNGGSEAGTVTSPSSLPFKNCPTTPVPFTITIIVNGTKKHLPPGKNPAPCTLPASGSGPTENITLPNAPPPNGTVDSVSGSSSTPGNVIVVATPQDNYEITSAYDQYQNPTNISWSKTGYSKNPFTLDYYNYIVSYPYYMHDTTVNYTQEYMLQEYVSSSTPSGYTCPSGYSLSGTTCTGTPTTTSAPKVNPTLEITTASILAMKICGSSCRGGGSSTGGGGSSTTTDAVPYYDYFPTGNSFDSYPSSSTTGPQLNEWCPRNFEVLAPPNTDVNGVSLTAPDSTPDQPTQVTISTQTTVQFSLDYWSQSIRNPFVLNGLSYTGHYYIEHANGSGQIPFDSPDIETFKIDGSTSTGNVVYPYNPSFTVSMPPLEVGDQICAEFTDTPQSGDVDENGKITDSSGSVDSSQIPTYNTCSNPVSNYPYSRAYGNDVIAGTVFSNAPDNQCNTSASIIASVTPDSGALPLGSGSQFASLSLGQITYYASAFLRNAIPTASNGLSLANTTGGYGGQYNGPCQPIYNYYLNRSSTAQKITVQNTQTYAVSANPGTVKLAFGSTNADNYVSLTAQTNSDTNITGEHVIYVNGNVLINSNINYDSSNASYDSTNGTVSGVPNLYVIASGNIYIGPNVTQLDGIYIAQSSCDWSSGSCQGGIINTCSDPSGVNNVSSNPSDAFPASILYSNCAQQLTVTGALIGHEVKLERTYASMRNSVGGENPFSGSSIHSCATGNGQISPAANQDCSAEIFDFNPINYLGNPNFGANGYNYDSIISLPPVL
jgi:hypothetical protein